MPRLAVEEYGPNGFRSPAPLKAAREVIQEAERFKLSGRSLRVPDRAGFDCGEAALNEFLQRLARKSHDWRGAKTFVSVDDANGKTTIATVLNQAGR